MSEANTMHDIFGQRLALLSSNSPERYGLEVPGWKEYIEKYKDPISQVINLRDEWSKCKNGLHVLGAAVNTVETVPNIFPQFTIDLRSYIFDYCPHMSFMPMLAKWTDSPDDNRFISLDTVDIEEGYENDPKVKEMVSYLYALCCGMAVMQFPSHNCKQVTPEYLFDRTIEEKDDVVYLVHMESTGWPLGEFIKLPILLNACTQWNFTPITGPRMMLPNFSFTDTTISVLYSQHPEAFYYTHAKSKMI